jgi:hypothetical protein
VKKDIVKPYYTNNMKDQIVCEFHWENGAVQVATVTKSDDNPDWKLIHEQHTEEAIEAFTAEFLDEHRRRQSEAKRRDSSAKVERETELLFQIKLETFEIEEVKSSKNRTLKSKIRRAKTPSEVYAYAAAIVMESLNGSTE